MSAYRPIASAHRVAGGGQLQCLALGVPVCALQGADRVGHGAKVAEFGAACERGPRTGPRFFSDRGSWEVAVPRELFRKILSLIDDLRPRPAPA